MKVLYKNQEWNVLCPKNLEFPKDVKGILRNVLIEKGDKRIITHINEVKKL